MLCQTNRRKRFEQTKSDEVSSRFASLHCFTLEYGTGSLTRNVGKYQSKLRTNTLCDTITVQTDRNPL